MFAFSSPRLYIFLMTSFFLLSPFMALIFKLNASPFGIYFDVMIVIGVQILFGFEGNLFELLDAQVSPNWGVGVDHSRRLGENLQCGGVLGPQQAGASAPRGCWNPEWPDLWHLEKQGLLWGVYLSWTQRLCHHKERDASYLSPYIPSAAWRPWHKLGHYCNVWNQLILTPELLLTYCMWFWDSVHPFTSLSHTIPICEDRTLHPRSYCKRSPE